MPLFNYIATPSDILTDIIAPSRDVAETLVGVGNFDASYDFVRIGPDEAGELSLTTEESTGVLSGLIPTQNDTTSIFVSNGNAIIADHGTLDEPEFAAVVWDLPTDPQTVTTIATDGESEIFITPNKTILFVLIDNVTPAIARDNARIGFVTHNLSTIVDVVYRPIVAAEPHRQVVDFWNELGVFNLGGFEITPTVTGFSTGSGSMMFPGVGVELSNRTENVIGIAAQSPLTTFTEFIGTTGVSTNIATQVMDVNSYDDNGTLTAIPGINNAVIKYLFMFPRNNPVPNIFIMHGQTVYANVSDAVTNADLDFETIQGNVPTLFAKGAVLLTRWVVRDSADLTDPDQSVFLSGAAFGSRLGAGGAAGGAGGGDFFGPASSSADEIVTFFDAAGKTGSDNANITAIDGALKSIAVNPLQIEENIFLAGGETLTYPDTDGLVGDVFTTDGTGTITIDSQIYDIITTDTTLEFDDKWGYIDASAGPIVLTLADNPRPGEKKTLYIADNTNPIELVSANPAFPVSALPEIAEDALEGLWTLASDFTDRFTTTHDLTSQGTLGSFVPVTVNGVSVMAWDVAQDDYLEATIDLYKGIPGGAARSMTFWYGANAGAPVTAEVWFSWGTNSSRRRYEYRLDGSGLVAAITNVNRVWSLASLNAANLFDGGMHHIGIIQNANTTQSIDLYIDGVLIAPISTIRGSINSGNAFNFKLGTNTSATQDLNGKLYDFRLFNRGISVQELTDIINDDLTSGVDLSIIPPRTVIDIVNDSPTWILAATTPIVLRALDARLDVVELNADKIFSGPSVMEIDDTGRVILDAEGEAKLDIVSPVDVNSSISFFEELDSQATITWEALNDTLNISAPNTGDTVFLDGGGLTSLELSGDTGNVNITDGVGGNINLFNGRLILHESSQEPFFALGGTTTTNFVGGMDYNDATNAVRLIHGNSSNTPDNETRMRINDTAFEKRVTVGNVTPSVSDHALEVISTTGAFKPPTMTTTQRDLLTVDEGAEINNSTTDQREEFRNGAWQPFGGGGGTPLLTVAGRAEEVFPAFSINQTSPVTLTAIDMIYHRVGGVETTEPISFGVYTVPAGQEGIYHFDLYCQVDRTAGDAADFFTVLISKNNAESGRNDTIRDEAKDGDWLHVHGDLDLLNTGDNFRIKLATSAGGVFDVSELVWSFHRVSA